MRIPERDSLLLEHQFIGSKRQRVMGQLPSLLSCCPMNASKILASALKVFLFLDSLAEAFMDLGYGLLISSSHCSSPLAKEDILLTAVQRKGERDSG